MADRPLRPATHHRLGEPLPRQLTNGTQAHPSAAALRPPFPASTSYGKCALSSISQPFGWLFQSQGEITHAFFTRAPLYSVLLRFTFDLHVLGAPPAFVLSQDQTLMFLHVARAVSLLPPLPVRLLNPARADSIYLIFFRFLKSKLTRFLITSYPYLVVKELRTLGSFSETEYPQSEMGL